MPRAMVLAVPPVSWMVNVRSSGPSLQFLRAQQRADLVGLAAQADDQHAGEVRVPRVAAERAAQQVHALAVRVHAAARAVGQRDHAVDVGEGRQRSRVKWSAMPRATVAEQFTVDRMPM